MSTLAVSAAACAAVSSSSLIGVSLLAGTQFVSLPLDCEVVHECGQGRPVLDLPFTGKLWYLGKLYPLHPGRLAMVSGRPHALGTAATNAVNRMSLTSGIHHERAD